MDTCPVKAHTDSVPSNSHTPVVGNHAWACPILAVDHGAPLMRRLVGLVLRSVELEEARQPSMTVGVFKPAPYRKSSHPLETAGPMV